MSEKSYRGFSYILIFFSIGMVLLWFWSKYIAFENLQFTSDLFSHFQMSYTWLEGKPLLFENRYGEHAKLHNYYFLPLLAPFTWFWGIYGLFAAQAGLVIGVLLLLLRRLRSLPVQSQMLLAMTAMVFFAGPFGFYVFYNPSYGFHAEILYVPLSLFFVLALCSERLWAVLLTGALIALVKEDGAVLGACLHVTYWIQKALSRRISWNLAVKKAFVAGAVWSIVFIAGMLLLSWQNDFGQTRISEALVKTAPLTTQSWQGYYKYLITRPFIWLLPLLGFMLLFFKPRYIVLFLIMALPVLAVQVVSSILYYPAHEFGTVWVPRFAVILAFSVGFLMMLIFQVRIKNRNHGVVFLLVVLAGTVCYAIQNFQLIRHVEVDPVFLLSEGLVHGPDDKLDENIRKIKCMVRQLPPRAPAATLDRWFGFYARQTLVWKDYLTLAWDPPLVVVLYDDKDPLAAHELLSQYSRIYVGERLVLISPDIKLDESQCN